MRVYRGACVWTDGQLEGALQSTRLSVFVPRHRHLGRSLCAWSCFRGTPYTLLFDFLTMQHVNK